MRFSLILNTYTLLEENVHSLSCRVEKEEKIIKKKRVISIRTVRNIRGCTKVFLPAIFDDTTENISELVCCL